MKGIVTSVQKIQSIVLWGHNLKGEVPGEIGKLGDLQTLDLSSNKLTGEIPKEIGDLRSLLHLKLSTNRLTGRIPTEIGKLEKLEELRLYENHLSGVIPKEIGNLRSLKFLGLNENRLSGSIPKEVGNLSNLEALWLSGWPDWRDDDDDQKTNQLTGEIPKEIGKLENLTSLDLSYNQLTGAIPPEIGELRSLVALDLPGNRFTGAIPKEIGKLNKLTWIALYDNQLEGEIPKEIGSLRTLEILWAGDNQLTGEIPQEIVSLQNLKELELAGNKLTGPIPSGLENLQQLEIISVGSNPMSGPIPPVLWNNDVSVSSYETCLVIDESGREAYQSFLERNELEEEDLYPGSVERPVKTDPPTRFPFKKYKQFTADVASKCLISTLSPCPSGVGTFLDFGCNICSFTTAVAKVMSGRNISSSSLTPLDVQKYLFDEGLQVEANGRVSLNSARYRQTVSTGPEQTGILTVWTERATNSNFFRWDDIVAELRLGNPVILMVPSQSTTRTLQEHLKGRKVHYIVAVAYDEEIGEKYGEPMGVVINDPGNGGSSYGRPSDDLYNYQPGHVPNFASPNAYDETAHVTLHDYFAALSRKGGSSSTVPENQKLKADYYGYWGNQLEDDMDNIKRWFNEAVLVRKFGEDSSQAHVIPESAWSNGQVALTLAQTRNSFRRKLITKVRHSLTDLTMPGGPNGPPLVFVASPIEIAFNNSATGQRYVSSVEIIAQPEDVLINREPVLLLDPPEGTDERGISEVHPPYFLELPPELLGVSLDLEIIGTGDGPYTIQYQHRSAGYEVVPAISGSITEGEFVEESIQLVSETSSPSLTITSTRRDPDGTFHMTWSGEGDVWVEGSQNLHDWEVLAGPINNVTSWSGKPLPGIESYVRLIQR